MENDMRQANERGFVQVNVIDEGDGVGGTLGVDSGQLGLWMFLATVTMLFAGFTSAYLVRRAGADWQPLPLPPVLWLNTALIVGSSLTLELARRRQQKPGANERSWLLVTTLLGVVFLIGQVGAWRALAAQGVYVPSHPHSSFFYILTGAHAAHLLGGMGALLLVVARPARLKLCATYWHFVGGLWVYVFLVLFVF